MAENCGESFDPGLTNYGCKTQAWGIQVMWLSGQCAVPLEGSVRVNFVVVIDCQGKDHAG